MQSEDKIATGVVHPRAFLVLQESLLAWMYNFKVCDQNSEEEDCFTRKYKKSLHEEEAGCIDLDLHICHLSIA